MAAGLITRVRRAAESTVEDAGASHARALALLTLLAILCFLPGFFTIPPIDRDESRFAQATKQMLETGDYIDIRFQDEARHKKPVGIYWMQVAAVRASGLGTDAPIWVYRIPSFLGALAGVLLTYWALLPLIGRQGAFLAGALMAATLLLGVEARIAKTDAMLFGLTVAAMGAMIRVYRDPERERRSLNPWIFWVAVGVGALVKGPITLMVAGLAAAVLCLRDRSARWLLGLRPLPGAIVALVIVAPWLIAIAIESGGAFFRDSVGADMLAKVGDAPEKHWGIPGYHTLLVWVLSWPAAPFLALALPWIWRHRGREEVIILLAWAIPTWIVFEAISTKLPHYVLPAYPAVLGLVALALVDQRGAAERLWQRFMLMGLWVLPLALLMIGTGGFFLLEGRFPWLAIPVLAGGVVLGAMAARVAREKIVAAVPVAVVAALVTYVGSHQFLVPQVSTFWLSPRLAALANSVPDCPNPRFASAGYEEPSLVFLTRTDLRIGNADAALDFLRGGPCRFAFIDAAPFANGMPSHERVFLSTAEQRGVQVEKIGGVEGRNINGGHVRPIGLWRIRP